MIRVADLHKQLMKNPEYRKEYEALGPEFARISAAIDARTAAERAQKNWHNLQPPAWKQLLEPRTVNEPHKE